MYCYDPDNPVANKAGKVMEHVWVAYILLGRNLSEHECVHHKNRDRTDNSPENLQVMTKSDHARLHLVEDRGIVFINCCCNSCGEIFEKTFTSSRAFCSVACSSGSRKVFDVSKEELELLVWQEPTSSLSKRLGVSDVAVAKRCKRLGISKPPRGYWRKLETGKLF